jgi:hypothetical protein
MPTLCVRYVNMYRFNDTSAFSSATDGLGAFRYRNVIDTIC